jgi:hypothetical protein
LRKSLARSSSLSGRSKSKKNLLADSFSSLSKSKKDDYHKWDDRDRSRERSPKKDLRKSLARSSSLSGRSKSKKNLLADSFSSLSKSKKDDYHKWDDSDRSRERSPKKKDLRKSLARSSSLSGRSKSKKNLLADSFSSLSKSKKDNYHKWDDRVRSRERSPKKDLRKSLARSSSLSGRSKSKKNLLADNYDSDEDRSSRRDSDPSRPRRSLTKFSSSSSKRDLFVEDMVAVLNDVPFKEHSSNEMRTSLSKAQSCRSTRSSSIDKRGSGSSRDRDNLSVSGYSSRDRHSSSEAKNISRDPDTLGMSDHSSYSRQSSVEKTSRSGDRDSRSTSEQPSHNRRSSSTDRRGNRSGRSKGQDSDRQNSTERRSTTNVRENELRGLHSRVNLFRSSISQVVHRYEQKASITIQTAARRFLARAQIRKLRLKKDYQMYITDKRETKVKQDAEVQIMQDRIDGKKRRTEVEIKAMRKTFEKTAPFLREDIRLEVEDKLQLEFEEAEAGTGHCDIDDEVVLALQEEQRQLLAEMEEQALLDEAMRKENVKLETANSDVTEMFQSISNFATKKTGSNSKYSRAEKKLAEQMLPKIQMDIDQSIIEAEIEMRQVEVYKRYVQKVLNGVHWAESYDQSLDDFVVESTLKHRSPA